MLIGASALAIDSLASPAGWLGGSRMSSHHVPAFAFAPAIPALRAAGLRQERPVVRNYLATAKDSVDDVQRLGSTRVPARVTMLDYTEEDGTAGDYSLNTEARYTVQAPKPGVASRFSRTILKPVVKPGSVGSVVKPDLAKSRSVVDKVTAQIAKASETISGGRNAQPATTDRVKIGSLSVPRMGIGTIAWSADTDEDFERINGITNYAIENGLNFFDTAERYGAKGKDLIPASLAAIGVPLPKGNNQYLGGDTESRLGMWVGDRGYVATKFGPVPWRNTAADVVEACRGSAGRLGVESVDLFQIHYPDIVQPFKGWAIPVGPTPFKIGSVLSPYKTRYQVGLVDEDLPGNEKALWDGLVEAYHSGLTKNVGVSNYGPKLLRKCHEYLAKRNVPLASNQIHFNLLYRRQGSLATIEVCKELDVQVLAYYPLAMGLLTGKLTQESLRNRTDLRGKQLLRYLEGGETSLTLGKVLRGDLNGFEFPNTPGKIPKPGLLHFLQILKGIAARLDKTPAQVSLNWIICKGAIPIPGARNLEQLQDNMGALGWRLSDDDVAQLDAAADNLPWEFSGTGFQTADSKFVGYGFEKWELD